MFLLPLSRVSCAMDLLRIVMDNCDNADPTLSVESEEQCFQRLRVCVSTQADRANLGRSRGRQSEYAVGMTSPPASQGLAWGLELI